MTARARDVAVLGDAPVARVVEELLAAQHVGRQLLDGDSGDRAERREHVRGARQQRARVEQRERAAEGVLHAIIPLTSSTAIAWGPLPTGTCDTRRPLAVSLTSFSKTSRKLPPCEATNSTSPSGAGALACTDSRSFDVAALLDDLRARLEVDGGDDGAHPALERERAPVAEHAALDVGLARADEAARAVGRDAQRRELVQEAAPGGLGVRALVEGELDGARDREGARVHDGDLAVGVGREEARHVEGAAEQGEPARGVDDERPRFDVA